MNASTVRAMSPTTAGPLAAAPVTRQSTKTSVSQSSASAHSKRPDNPKRSSSQSPTNAAHTAQRQQQPALPGRAGRYVLNARQQPQVATTASQKARVVLLWLRTFQVGSGMNCNSMHGIGVKVHEMSRYTRRPEPEPAAYGPPSSNPAAQQAFCAPDGV